MPKQKIKKVPFFKNKTTLSVIHTFWEKIGHFYPPILPIFA